MMHSRENDDLLSKIHMLKVENRQLTSIIESKSFEIHLLADIVDRQLDTVKRLDQHIAILEKEKSELEKKLAIATTRCGNAEYHLNRCLDSKS